MNVTWKFSLALLACIVLSSCALKPRSFVDPEYHKASYESIQPLATPIPSRVEAEFQRNGKSLPAVNAELQNHVERTLLASGVFIPSTDPATETRIHVTANNIADLAAARSQGFKTGLTLGGSGSMVDDNYEFVFLYTGSAGKKHSYAGKHAIHTAIGSTEQPAGLQPTTVADAFGRVVEDSVLNFVLDLQQSGVLQ